MQKSLLVFEKVLFWLFIVVLVGIPLIPKVSFIGVPETFVAIRVEDFLIAALVGLTALYLLLSKKYISLLKDPLIQVMGLFFFIGALSVFSAIFVTHTVSPLLSMLHWARRIEYMILLPIAMTLVRTKRQFYICLIAMVGVILAVNIYALGQQYLQWPVCTTTNSDLAAKGCVTLTPDARVNSTFAGHYDLPVFVVMTVTIGAALYFGVRKLWQKVLILFLSGFSFVILVMTASRFSFIAVLVGIFSTLILLKKKMYIALIVLLSVAALVYPSQLRDRFISGVTVFFGQSSDTYSTKNNLQQKQSKLNLNTIPSTGSSWLQKATVSADIAPDIVPGEPTDTTELGAFRSMNIRFNVEWPRAINAFSKNPLLGTGYASIGLATDGDYLRMLGEVGLLGTLCFALLLFIIIKRIWPLRKLKTLNRYYAVGVLALILAFLVNATFIDVFEASKVASLFWIFLGVALGMARYETD